MNMRKLLFIGMVILSALPTSLLFGQQVTITDTDYQHLKGSNQLVPGAKYSIINTNTGVEHHLSPRSTERANNCACYTPHDGTYTLAMAPNDDGSTANIPIPFNFCLYGTNYSSLWINNNGNITFDAAYATFSAVGFPSATYVMVAPFWGDVDTRGIGEVWYKITPTAVYVNWENCGYFNNYTDKTNTFSLIITDGTDPVIGVGNNVAFCYQDMQWTTGDASSGVGGFGGVAATVGCNKGDGTSFVQFGRFDSPGIAYFGPYATNNGVSWLDNQSFIFNACNATNIAPALAGGVSLCDTLFSCEGDTLIDTLTFLAPEAGQITTLTASSASPDFSVLNITNGNTATIIYQIIGITPGTIDFTVTATDDGVPVQSVGYTFSVYVAPLSSVPLPIITGDTLLCPGHNAFLEVTNATYDEILWSTGSDSSSTNAPTAGLYTVVATNGLCSKSASVNITFVPGPEIYIMDSTACSATSVLFNSFAPNDIISSYSWNFGAGSPSTSTDSTPTVIFPGLGSFPVSLTVTNPEGCTSTVNRIFNVLNGPSMTMGIYPICISRFTFDPSGAGDSTWVIDWFMGDGSAFLDQDSSQFNYIYPLPGTYDVTMIVTNAEGCTDSLTQQVIVEDTLTINMPNVLIQSSAAGNNKFDMQVIKPNFNLCVEYTFVVFDRWGLKVYEAYNDPYNPDLFCADCFQGKTEGGTNLSPGVYYYLLQGNYKVEDHGFITIFD